MKKYRVTCQAGGVNTGLVAGVALGLAAALFLTHDILITNFLAFRLCRADPEPKTFVRKTVEFPGSIYWEDTIYPGFDEKDRLLMIRNYLDGVHLKTMGLNGPDGSLYIYTATPEDWRASREFKAASGMVKGYFTLLDSETRAIASRGQRLVHGKPPVFNYSVALKPVPLTAFERRYLWSDELIITDNITGEVIGFNRRLMRRWYLLQLKPFGGCLSMAELYSVSIYGDPLTYGFADEVFFANRTSNNIIMNFKCRRAFKSKL